MNPPASPPTSTYLLLFRNTGPENHRHLSADERQQLMQRWNAWFEGLLETGQAVEGQPLEMETRMVSGQGGARIVDGPFPEAKEAIGGYVRLEVPDLETATAIARRHPGLEHGLQIEIRKLVDGCHLGVTTRRLPR